MINKLARFAVWELKTAANGCRYNEPRHSNSHTNTSSIENPTLAEVKCWEFWGKMGFMSTWPQSRGEYMPTSGVSRKALDHLMKCFRTPGSLLNIERAHDTSFLVLSHLTSNINICCECYFVVGDCITQIQLVLWITSWDWYALQLKPRERIIFGGLSPAPWTEIREREEARTV